MLFVWRFCDSSTEYVDVIAYNEDADPRERLNARIPGGFNARGAAAADRKPYEIVLEKELSA